MQYTELINLTRITFWHILFFPLYLEIFPVTFIFINKYNEPNPANKQNYNINDCPENKRKVEKWGIKKE
jgi:quinol-cytochrome oxidoreductase complex cytochrome b subunit